VKSLKDLRSEKDGKAEESIVLKKAGKGGKKAIEKKIKKMLDFDLGIK
jgi:hypothetical protein